MNKQLGEIIKSIIDEFVSREEVLKELLNDKEKEITQLRNELKALDD